MLLFTADSDMILIDLATPSLETSGVNSNQKVQMDAVMEIDEEGRPIFAPAQNTVYKRSFPRGSLQDGFLPSTRSKTWARTKAARCRSRPTA